jgi:hypothetical protein
MPPPEFHLEKWRQSIKRLETERFSRIAPTHFGIFSDPDWHLAATTNALDDIDAWMNEYMPGGPDVNEINSHLIRWAEERAGRDNVPPEQIKAYESANPTWMSGYGIQRYWRKYRQEQPSHTVIKHDASRS